MFIKIRNNKDPKNPREFVVAQSSLAHYQSLKGFEYIGKCDEAGRITVPAEEDEDYKKRSLEDHINSVEQHLQKKTAKTAETPGSEITEEDEDD